MTAFPIPNLPELSEIPPGLLYPHQSDEVAFLLSKKRVVLADDMGLGKTRQAIVAMNVGASDGAILVVCPASLKLNWRREIRMVDPDAVVEVIGTEDGAPKGTPGCPSRLRSSGAWFHKCPRRASRVYRPR